MFECEITYVYKEEGTNKEVRIELKNLEVLVEKDSEDHEQLIAIIAFLFNGLSGAPDRNSSIRKLHLGNVEIRGSGKEISFQPLHDKAGSTRNSDKSMLGKHRLPPSSPGIFFLYICVLHALYKGEDLRKLFPDGKTDALSTLAAYLLDVEKIDLAQMRKFFSHITNASSQKTKESTELHADPLAAQNVNHTPATHEAYYSSRHVDQENEFYSDYYKLLGETIDQVTIEMLPFSKQQTLDALGKLYPSPEPPRFRNEEQEQLVRSTRFGSTKHVFATMKCGDGKTLPWLLESVTSALNSRESQVHVLVEPFNFLADTHYLNTQDMCNKLKKEGINIRVQSFTASEINEHKLPTSLHLSPPELLILSIDAAANFLRFHKSTLLKWKSNGTLGKVFVDEAQILLSEVSFRPKVIQAQKRWAEIGAQVILLSGSFPHQLAPSLMKYLGLASGEHSCEVIKSRDLIGSNLRFTAIDGGINGDKNPQNLVEIAGRVIKHKLGNDKQHLIHVICQKREECKAIKQYLVDDGCLNGSDCDIITGETPTTESLSTAKRWISGEIKILVTTTAGLVGNESKNARTIIVVGLIYNISNLLQAMGRLRPEQRDEYASLIQIVGKADKFHMDKSDLLIEEMKINKMIVDQDVLTAKQFFHQNCYYQMFEQKQCILISLGKAIGEANERNRCERCNWCKKGKILITESEFMEQDSSHIGVIECGEPPFKRPKLDQTADNTNATPSTSDAIWECHTDTDAHSNSILRLAELAQKASDSRDNTKKNYVKKLFDAIALDSKNQDGACYSCGHTGHYGNKCPHLPGKKRNDLDQWLEDRGICKRCFGPFSTNKCPNHCEMGLGLKKRVFQYITHHHETDAIISVLKEKLCSEENRIEFWKILYDFEVGNKQVLKE